MWSDGRETAEEKERGAFKLSQQGREEGFVVQECEENT